MAGSASQSGSIEALVNDLANYATRSRARTRLILAGQAAVPALARALQSPIEGMAWAAAKTLGDIGGDEATESLLNALGNTAVKDAALDALRRITGRDLGDNADAWRQALAAGAVKGATSERGSSDEEFARALTNERISVEKGSSGYTFTVQLSGGRRQKVDMMLSLKDADGSPLVAFYTECGPATQDRYEWALKTNLKVPFGSIALRDTADGPKFVMVDAYLREGATTRQLARALDMLARRADSIEQTITGADKL